MWPYLQHLTGEPPAYPDLGTVSTMGLPAEHAGWGFAYAV